MAKSPPGRRRGFYDLDAPPVRIATPHMPLLAADVVEIIAGSR